jgi:uncharacterized protein
MRSRTGEVVGDPHFQWAVLLAFPVWAALASGIGGSLYRPADASAWLRFALWQPVLEEVFFRSLLLGWLLRVASPRRLAGISVANALTTAAFVAMHLLAQPPVWAIAVAAPSLLFGHLRERLRSAGPAIFLHAFYNAGFGAVAWAVA